MVDFGESTFSVKGDIGAKTRIMLENELTAILLLGHGSRAQEANEAMYRVAQDLKEQGQYSIVECAFLEFNAPDIAGGLSLCKEQGAKRVIIIPYFLHAGVHVLKDLPRIIGDWWGANEATEVLLGKPFGYSPLITQLVQQRIEEVVSNQSSVISS
jgi:sirohydrochlorin ferrochelatase